MSDSRRQEFLDFIHAEPDNNAARLVYADWLEEEVEENERAELIRIQIERAELPEWDAQQIPLMLREKELLKQHSEEWRQDLPQIKGVTWGEFRRGFVATASFSGVDLLSKTASRCWATTPLESISVRWPKRREYMNYLQPIPGLRELSIRSRAVDHDAARQMADSPLLSTLRALEVRECALGFEGFAWLIASPHLKNLKALRAPANSIGNSGINALLLSKSLTSLEELDLSETGAYGRYNEDPLITEEGMEMLATWKGLSQIRSLTLTGNNIGSGGLKALLRSPYVGGLKKLVLRENELESPALKGFTDTHADLQLDVLDLGQNVLRAQSTSHLAKSDCLRELKMLTLDRCELNDNDAKQLAKAPFISSLRKLNVATNYFKRDGIKALFESEPKCLHTLNLGANDLRDDGVAYLASSPSSDTLLELDLSFMRVGDKALRALGESAYLRNLLILDMKSSNWESRRIEAFKKSSLAKRLVVLEMEEVDIPF